MGKGRKRTKARLLNASVGGVEGSTDWVSFLFIAFRKADGMVNPEGCTVEFVPAHCCRWPSSSPSYSSSSKLVTIIPVIPNIRKLDAIGRSGEEDVKGSENMQHATGRLTIFLWFVPRLGGHLDVIHVGGRRFIDRSWPE